MSESYLPTHEWARLEGGLVVIGLSPFAAGEVGDVIHVQLPKVGQAVRRGTACAEIESVKSVNDVYAPVDGVVEAVNPELAAHPELVNQDALGRGWFARIRPGGADPLAGLLTGAAYAAQTKR
jgi:glycine cleavage system H protein